MPARVSLVVATLACLGLGGCVAYRGGAVPRVEPSTIAVPAVQRVVSYDLTVQDNVGDDYQLQRAVTRELEAALRMAGGDLKPSGSVAQPDEVMTVHVVVRGCPAAEVLSALVSGFSMTVVPAYARVDVGLDALVTSRNGSRRAYWYHDTCTVWIELFLLPLTNDPDRVLEHLVADMARSLARDMQRDGLLPRPGTGAG